MKKSHLILIFIFFLGIISYSFLNPDYLEWSTEKKLSYADFKGSAPKNGNAVSLTTLITYQTKQSTGGVPQITVLNYVDRNASWIKVKKPEILEIQQIKFDYSELYVRKARKLMIEMNKKGIKDKQKYIDAITKIAANSEKRQRKNNVLLEDQPHLIKIMKKDVSDSLQIYKNYKK